MTLRNALELSTFLLVLLGFAALVLSGPLPVGLIIVGASAITLGVCSRLTGISPIARVLGPRGSHAVLLIIVGVFGFDLLISRDLLSASLYLLVLLMSYQVLHLEEGTDYLQLAAISFMALVGSAAFASAVWFGAIALLYLVTAVWMLLLYHFWSEEQGSRGAGSVLKNYLAGSRVFWWTNVMAVTALCVSMLVFFMIPRVGAGFFQKARTDAIRVSGFSTSVEPGDLKPVGQDATIVMRVRIPEDQNAIDPKNETLYMRGMAYDHYDGRNWSNTFDPSPVSRRGDEFDVRPSDVGGDVRQEVVLEPVDTRILFGIPSVVGVQGPFENLAADDAGVLYMRHPPYAPFSYTARSVTRRVTSAERRQTDVTYPLDLQRAYGQLPDLDRRVNALAQTITADATTAYQAVRAIERYLKTNYDYSVEMTAEAGPLSPLEAFLFTWKTGYCEHFATAMTVLVRAVGIPARLVTGFLEGEWNEFGRYHAFRQRDAHAWTEVYFPQSGWVVVDATPVADRDETSVWTTAGRMADWIRFSWKRYIVEYSLQDQLAMARGVQAWTGRLESMGRSLVGVLEEGVDRLKRATTRMVRVHSPDQLLVEALAAGTILVGMGLLARRIRNPGFLFWRPGRSRSSESGQGARVYQRMLTHLASQGIVKDPNATPWEFHARVSKEWQDVEPLVQSLTAWYCRIRYGAAGMSHSEFTDVESWLRQLCATRKRQESGPTHIRRRF